MRLVDFNCWPGGGGVRYIEILSKIATQYVWKTTLYLKRPVAGVSKGQTTEKNET